MELFKQIFSLGLGAAIATKEQVEKVVDSLVKKGEISKDESRELINQWVEKGEQARQELDESVKTSVNRTLSSLNLVTKEEFQALEKRIQTIEQKIQVLENKQE